MESGIWLAIGAVIGALGVIAGQLISAKRGERIEHNRWTQEKAKEVRQAIRENRKERARPIMEALIVLVPYIQCLGMS